MLVVCNFTPVVREGYRIGVPGPGVYREMLNSDAAVYGGSNAGSGGSVASEPVRSHGRDHSLLLTLPPLGCVFLQRDGGSA